MFSMIVGICILVISLVLCVMSHIKNFEKLSLATLIANGISCIYNIIWMLSVNKLCDKSRFAIKDLYVATTLSTTFLLISLLICIFASFRFFVLIKIGLSRVAFAPVSSDPQYKTLRIVTVVSSIGVLLLGVSAIVIDYFL